MRSRAWLLTLGALFTTGAGADAGSNASTMIKFASIWEQPNDDAVLDDWYRARHSREVLLFVGPWLRRYWAYRSLEVPGEADRFNVVRYRLTEMWYDDLAARDEALRALYPLSRPPVDVDRYPAQTRIANIYVTAIPTERYVDGWPRERPSYTRWIFFLRYPEGVAIEDGERWFTTDHGPDLARLPGVRRLVCFKSAAPPDPGAWARMCEMWFDDYDGWKQALMASPPEFTPPPWGGTFPYTDIISTFTGTLPDMDFIRDSDAPR